MNKKYIFIIITLLIIGGIIWLWFWYSNEKDLIMPSEENIPQNEEESSQLSHEYAELIGYNFMLDFLDISPSQNNPEAETRIYQALSVNAKKEVSQETLASDIASFVGVQDIPDQGVSVEDLQVNSKSSATLVVGLNYSGGRIIRHIQLIAEENKWKVDKIINPEESSDFNQTGNIVFGNPGMKEGTWYLVYDEAGAPGKSVELYFDESSLCEGMSCEEIITEEIKGNRVNIEGKKTGDQIKIKSITFLNSSQKVKFIAKAWIIKNSPTFLFDGMDLQFSEIRGLDLVDCEDCYEVDFTFNSRYSGYGNREGEILAQVVTPHKISLLVKDNSVEKVATDQVFDEIKGELIK